MTASGRVYIIDPPSPSASRSEWQRFLNEMLEHDDQEHPQIQEAIDEARQLIAEYQSGSGSNRHAMRRTRTAID